MSKFIKLTQVGVFNTAYLIRVDLIYDVSEYNVSDETNLHYGSNSIFGIKDVRRGLYLANIFFKETVHEIFEKLNEKQH